MIERDISRSLDEQRAKNEGRKTSWRERVDPIKNRQRKMFL
jgi:hypothetical protein